MNKILKTRLKLRHELEAPEWMRRFGSGWISGVLGLVLGVAALLLVISVRLPGPFSVPELRALHESQRFRLAIQILLVAAFVLSALCLVLRPKKLLGACALAATLLAALIGNTNLAPLVGHLTPLYLGLDWFVLNVLFTGFLFVPVERIFPQNPAQPLFRDQWREDLFYYLVSSMMVQILTFLTFLPAKSLVALLPLQSARAWIGALPF